MDLSPAKFSSCLGRAARLAGQKLGEFVGLLAKYMTGFLVAFLLVTVLLFFPFGIVGTLRQRGWLPAFLDWD